MLITIPNGYRMTHGAYKKTKSKDIGKLLHHDDCLKTLFEKYPDCIYGCAIVEKYNYIDLITNKTCKESPRSIFVFGDNLIGKGKAGQAIIRDEPNSFGIPTKRLPSMKPGSFFSDKPDEIKIVKNRIKLLKSKDKQICLPTNPMGSGLARLKEKSPLIHKIIMEELYNT